MIRNGKNLAIVILGLVPRTHRSAGARPAFCCSVATNIAFRIRGTMGPRDEPEDDKFRDVGCIKRSADAPIEHSIDAPSVQYGGKCNAPYCTLRAVLMEQGLRTP